MDSARISKIQKAKMYAEERRERIRFNSFEATVRGNNSTHRVRYTNGKFDCDNDTFRKYGYSTHTITMERVLEGMISSPAESDTPVMADSSRISRIQKAKIYAEEREQRIEFHNFVVTVKGKNTTHEIRYTDGKFDCDDDFFQAHGYSAHTMAMERVLQGMLRLAQAEEIS